MTTTTTTAGTATTTSSVITDTTELVSKWIVTASPPLNNDDDEPTVETLSEVDEWQTKASHWLGFSMRFDDTTLDPTIVKEGLAKLLHHIPALGARVVVSNDGNNENPHNLHQLALLSDDDETQQDEKKAKQGVIFEYYKGTVVSSSSDDGTSIQLPNDTHTRQYWKQAGLEAPGPGYSGDPEHLQQRRIMGHRVTDPVKPAKDTAELYQRMESEIGMPHNPFRLWTLLSRVVPRAIWCMSRQQEVELRIPSVQLAALKEAITSKLDNNDDNDNWVSSFEVLIASLLLAEWTTSGAPPTQQQQRHNLHVCCDLRGRSERFSKDYFGNAAFDFCQPMKELASTTKYEYTMESLVPLAQQVHAAMRLGLQHAESNACKSKDWFEAARHLGLKNTYDIWSPVILDVLRGDGTFVNSWDKKWLDVSMGGTSDQKAASSMVAWFGTLQNLFVEVPRSSKMGDSTIYLALPAAHAKRFRTFCMEMKDNKDVTLPFEVVMDSP